MLTTCYQSPQVINLKHVFSFMSLTNENNLISVYRSTGKTHSRQTSVPISDPLLRQQDYVRRNGKVKPGGLKVPFDFSQVKFGSNAHLYLTEPGSSPPESEQRLTGTQIEWSVQIRDSEVADQPLLFGTKRNSMPLQFCVFYKHFSDIFSCFLFYFFLEERRTCPN